MTSSTSTPKLYTSRFADVDLDMVADADMVAEADVMVADAVMEGDLHVPFGSSGAAYDRVPESGVGERISRSEVR
jgi:hypothetical protein